MITIVVNQTITRVTGENREHLIRMLNEAPEPIPFESFEGFIELRTSPSNLIFLWVNFPGATWSDPGNRLLEARAFSAIAAQNRPEPGDYEKSWPFKHQPLPHQLPVFAAARLMTNMSLAPVAMGTGKTKMILDIAADKFMRGEIDGLCVIAPNGVNRQWVEKAIPEHMTAEVMPVRAAVWKSTKTTPRAVTNQNFDRNRRLRVLTFNVEAFSREGSKAYHAAREFLLSGSIMLVLDESSRVKSPKAIRTKSILMLRQYAAVRAILSGTPITRGLEDLYSQFAFLDPAIIGATNFYAFRNRYCVTTPAYYGAGPGAVKVVGYRNVDEFISKIAPVTFVVPKDVLGLPEKTYEQKPVELTPEQQRIYTALKNELIEDLRSEKIKNPANAAVRLMRMQQVLSGSKVEYEERELQDGEEGDVLVVQSVVPVPSRRLEALYDTLLGHDGPAVIWCRFSDDIKDVESFLTDNGHSVVTYFGETKSADREDAVRKFKAGEVEYFVANPDAAGTGLDGLQVAELAVYYSNSFRAESRWQSEDRIHRIGMKGRAHYVDLVAPDTVDELVLANLKSKGDLARAVFDNPGLLEAPAQQQEAA